MRRAVVPLATLLALTGCGGGDDDGLPASVAAFEHRLEAPRGVLHVVTDEVRVLPEQRAPDLPPGGWRDEVWLDLGGSGWRAHRVTRDGGFLQIADERGVRTFTRWGFTGHNPADHERADFLMRPWRAAVVVDPVGLVREGRLTAVGRATIRGRAAHIAVVEPDPSLNTRLYIARDDGDLLRILHRRVRAGRMRTIVQDYLVFEVRGQRPRNLDEFLRRN